MIIAILTILASVFLSPVSEYFCCCYHFGQNGSIRVDRIQHRLLHIGYCFADLSSKRNVFASVFLSCCGLVVCMYEVFSGRSRHDVTDHAVCIIFFCVCMETIRTYSVLQPTCIASRIDCGTTKRKCCVVDQSLFCCTVCDFNLCLYLSRRLAADRDTRL